MAERDMNPQAGNARRFTIQAEAGETAIDIVLPARLPNNRAPNNYRVVKKDIPELAKTKTFNGKPVKWINNHGIRLRGNFPVKRGGSEQDPFYSDVAREEFTHEVIIAGPAPQGYSTLVYFDGTDVQPANATVDSAGFYHYNLDIGDPPSGWGG